MPDRFAFTRRTGAAIMVLALASLALVALCAPDSLGMVTSTVIPAAIASRAGLVASANWAETRDRKS